jgi:hypothetical protein
VHEAVGEAAVVHTGARSSHRRQQLRHQRWIDSVIDDNKPMLLIVRPLRSGGKAPLGR